VLPVVFAVFAHRWDYRGAMAPLLWLVSIFIGVALYIDPSFDSSVLWRLPLELQVWRPIVIRFAILSVALFALGRWLSPGAFLWFPRWRPGLWLALIVAYPLLSALPQGIIWRVFLAHRYAELFGDQLPLVCAGAGAFSLAHLAFWNRTALVVTALGGALFFSTYLRTHSMLAATFEHGAYGLVAFTAGLGPFLYRGANTAAAAHSGSHA
jgi:hypothetical protein